MAVVALLLVASAIGAVGVLGTVGVRAASARRQRARLRHRLARARPSPAAPLDQAGRRPPRRPLGARAHLGASLAVGGAIALLAGPVVGVLVGGALAALPHARARSARQRRDAAAVSAVPDVIDLVRLAVDAGLGPGEAVVTVADHLVDPGDPGERGGAGEVGDDGDPVGVALRRVRLRVARGDRLVDALGELEALGEPARALHEALVASHRHGVPLVPALERAGVDARDIRRRRREEVVRVLPVKLLLPLVGCTLPALLLLTVVPLVSRSLPSLAP